MHGDGCFIAAPVSRFDGIGCVAVSIEPLLDRVLIPAVRNRSDSAYLRIPVRHTVVMNLQLLGHIVGFPVLHAGEGGRIALLDQLAGAGVARVIRLVQHLDVEVVHPVLGDRHLALPHPGSGVHFRQGQGFVRQAVPDAGHAGAAIRCRNHKIAVHKVVRRIVVKAVPSDMSDVSRDLSALDGGRGRTVVRLHTGDGDGDVV